MRLLFAVFALLQLSWVVLGEGGGRGEKGGGRGEKGGGRGEKGGGRGQRTSRRSFRSFRSFMMCGGRQQQGEAYEPIDPQQGQRTPQKNRQAAKQKDATGAQQVVQAEVGAVVGPGDGAALRVAAPVIPPKVAAVPPKAVAAVPPKAVAAVPPKAVAAVPPKAGAAVPPKTGQGAQEGRLKVAEQNDAAQQQRHVAHRNGPLQHKINAVGGVQQQQQHAPHGAAAAPQQPNISATSSVAASRVAAPPTTTVKKAIITKAPAPTVQVQTPPIAPEAQQNARNSPPARRVAQAPKALQQNVSMPGATNRPETGQTGASLLPPPKVVAASTSSQPASMRSAASVPGITPTCSNSNSGLHPPQAVPKPQPSAPVDEQYSFNEATAIYFVGAGEYRTERDVKIVSYTQNSKYVEMVFQKGRDKWFLYTGTPGPGDTDYNGDGSIQELLKYYWEKPCVNLRYPENSDYIFITRSDDDITALPFSVKVVKLCQEDAPLV